MAAAYAALASLMHTIHEIEHHHSPPISLDKQQAQSLTQNITFLQGFLESYDPPISDDELADPLVVCIADAAYAVEDVIETHIVDTIRLSSSRHNQTKLTRIFNCRKVEELIKFINFYQNLQRVIEEMDLVNEMARMRIDTSEEAAVPASSSDAAYSTVPSSSTVPPISLDKQQAQSLTQNGTFVHGFLESYNSPVSDEESADPLVMRIADAAYAAEDVIESHIVDTIRLIEDRRSTPNQTKLTRRLFNCFHSPKTKCINFYKNLQRVIVKKDLVNTMAMMSIDTSGAAAVPAAASSTFSTSGPRSTTTVVDFEDASLRIMEKLTEDRPHRQVIPIVGMGGIGKTTLARNVYDQKLIKEHFYICAWATISQQHNTRETLCEVYSQVTNTDKKQLSGMDETELGLKIHKYLSRRRFLIVMDDMWSIDAWTEIQHFFPKNQNGSRILVTTRLLKLSSQLNNDYIHQVSFLNEASGWNLFSKIMFGDENSCPRVLKKIGKKIVNGCRGLPLSIVVVAGLLKKLDATERCWESIWSNLTSVVNLENDKHCLRLLRLSYNHLPVHLKPCFLYMGVFEEDAEISVSTLVKLWISEGFLKPINGESLETSAMRFLKDLVDRNLVLISMLGSTGNIKSCKIHDLLRDLCLKEGQRDGFYHVLGQRSPRCINKERRVVIPKNASKRKVLGVWRSMTHARSLIFQYKIRNVPDCSNLRLLRTFHTHFVYFECVSFTDSFAHQHVNLRYLNIKGRKCENMSSFLSSVSLLWNLHTIIVSYSNNPTTHTIPEIWKMPQLRHIEFIDYTLCLPDPPSVDDDAMIIMENLQVLKGVRDFKCCEGVVKRIPNIKKLKIGFSGIMGSNVDEYFFSNIKLLCKLESLWVHDSSPNSSLNNLTFPHSLKKLLIYFNQGFDWEENMLEKMGSLPFLEKLCLMKRFFGMGRWEIVEGQFPCLKYLSLQSCYGLEHLTAAEEESSIFPCIEQIHLQCLKDLKSIPREIGNIPTLQEIKIIYCNEEAVKSAKEMVDEQVELQGDQLPFRVVVHLGRRMMNQELRQSLTGPNFEVFTHDKSSSHEHRNLKSPIFHSFASFFSSFSSSFVHLLFFW